MQLWCHFSGLYTNKVPVTQSSPKSSFILLCAFLYSLQHVSIIGALLLCYCSCTMFLHLPSHTALSFISYHIISSAISLNCWIWWLIFIDVYKAKWQIYNICFIRQEHFMHVRHSALCKLTFPLLLSLFSCELFPLHPFLLPSVSLYLLSSRDLFHHMSLVSFQELDVA